MDTSLSILYLNLLSSMQSCSKAIEVTAVRLGQQTSHPFTSRGTGARPSSEWQRSPAKEPMSSRMH